MLGTELNIRCTKTPEDETLAFLVLNLTKLENYIFVLKIHFLHKLHSCLTCNFFEKLSIANMVKSDDFIPLNVCNEL